MHSNQEHKLSEATGSNVRPVGKKAVCLTDNRGITNPLQLKSSSTAPSAPPESVTTNTFLQDNRSQRPVFQLRSFTGNDEVVQLARVKTSRRRTVSGHGKLRRGPGKGPIIPYTIPPGKSIMRPAPPGATLGNLSMVLNEKKRLTRKQLMKRLKVSTTKELWTNKHVATLVKNNNGIPKTPTQAQALDDIVNGKALTGGQKGSLARLESRPEFEKWAQTHVGSESFKTFKGGQTIEDMEFTEFEPNLKSAKAHSDNEFVTAPTILSDYVAANPTKNHFTTNACSFDEQSPFTGFQLDEQ